MRPGETVLACPTCGEVAGLEVRAETLAGFGSRKASVMVVCRTCPKAWRSYARAALERALETEAGRARAAVQGLFAAWAHPDARELLERARAKGAA